MRSSTVVALFAGSAAAQSTAVVFNPMMPAKTLTVLGSSSGTTTYANLCSDGGAPASWLSSVTAGASGAASSVASARSSIASSVASSVRSAAGTLEMTPIAAPSTTAAARLRRQEDGLFGGFCEPITLKQGSSSLEYHLEDPTKGALTVDMNCAWKGDMTTADLTCTAVQSGVIASVQSIKGTTSQVIKASEIAEGSMIQTVSVTQDASNSGSATTSGSRSDSTNATSTASGSGAPAATGAAAGAPLSKGMMAFVGGAAGVFAAALAL